MIKSPSPTKPLKSDFSLHAHETVDTNVLMKMKKKEENSEYLREKWQQCISIYISRFDELGEYSCIVFVTMPDLHLEHR